MSEQNRTGDHICYYSDLRRFRNDYPEWQITTTLNQILEEFAAAYAANTVVAA